MNLKDLNKEVDNFRSIKKDTLRDSMVKSIYRQAEDVSKDVVEEETRKTDWDNKIDEILTSPLFGYPIMLLLLGTIFWITITGANYPSQILANILFTIEDYLSTFVLGLGAPEWFHGIVVLGIYRTLAWVISVMLPPMAIFFPLFTLLEDLGYLPRVAFNMDRLFKACGTHGKQALTMCMGFGCNAAGVIACRIIDSPREKIIAIVTNNFVPCNGRFPTLIALSMIFMGGLAASSGGTLLATFVVVGMVLIGIAITLLVSFTLSKTLLKGIPSSFTLELPPYRKPQFGRIIVRSILDRTIFVLGRAIVVAAPAGLVIWILANTYIGELSVLATCANFLDPFARSLGMDGFILMAFILGLPANEIVLPILIMSYLSTGAMLEFESLNELANLFIAQGWTWLTALSTMLFALLHFPCGTTLWTIAKETKNAKWTFFAFLMPTMVAIIVCFVVAQIVMGLGWV
ncbi:ferrous iron transport protein B [Desulfonispora thiosulfatigenes DSM 11270]|uniref:Ferrous iron transport protein B n=1 Tax=Desulfonispora thiosulfatigenes DSM 11270 TaxID=656914 RepID=A0A1W1UL11_DESTI|nr:nucleoside recognition domain-containing protein [Desulfonispora thiosulfatigenes]SMB81767.1 ferrous iron transport protein B [Desulfonispora thiosulfatigenes DSM 11270]